MNRHRLTSTEVGYALNSDFLFDWLSDLYTKTRICIAFQLSVQMCICNDTVGLVENTNQENVPLID